MTVSRKRIEWIDLAKGFCILLVVFDHAFNALGDGDYPLRLQMSAFRMPLYFILSGLFFKQYESLWGFLKRKVNKLLIPFLFFLIFTSILPFFIVHHYVQWKLLIFRGIIVYNSPIWFLLCLFIDNVIFYLIQMFSEWLSPKYKTALVLTFSICLGYLGMCLSILGIKLLFYIDAALTALPFFAFGWWLFRHSRFLSSPFHLSRDLPMIIGAVLFVGLFSVPVTWRENKLGTNALLAAYPCGIVGTMLILLVSKGLKRLPLVSLWGRYSIIILCTHYLFVLGFIKFLSSHGLFSRMIQSLIAFCLTVLICHFLIPFMRKYLPHVTAQKDVIKV